MGGGSSSSSSASTTTSAQTTGGSGDSSPTVSAGGDVTLETGGQQVTLAALDNMAAVVNNALAGAAEFANRIAGNQAEAAAAAGANDTALLSTVLQSNAGLAANVQSGGASGANKLTLYIVAAGLAVLALILWRK